MKTISKNMNMLELKSPQPPFQGGAVEIPLAKGGRGISILMMIGVGWLLSTPLQAQETATPGDTDTDAAPAVEAVEPQPSPMEAAGLSDAVQLAATELEAPVITPGPPITLAEALQRAEEQNLDMQSAALEIEKAKAGLSKSWGLVLPYVQGKVEYTHMDHADVMDLGASLSDSMQPIVNALLNGGLMTVDEALAMADTDPLLANPQEKLTAALQVMMPLVNPEAWLHIQTAKKGVEVATLSIENAKRQILLGTAQAYFMVLTTRDLIDFYFSQMKTTQEQLRVANARFNSGKAMRIDVIRAETDFEQARQSLLSASLSYDNARDTLGQLLGMEGLPQPADTPLLATPQGDDTSLQQRAASLRTDMKVNAARLELLQRQKKAVYGQFLPKLDMMWQGSYQFTELPDMGSDDRSRWALMFTLTIPLYNHYRYAELDEKRAAIRQAQLNMENTEQKASLAVRKARRDYANALIQVATAEKQAALAEEGVTLTDAAYRNGRGTSLDVTLARQTHIAAGLNLTTSQLKAQLALLSLLDAIGEDIPSQIQ
ncbi:MAG: TolC family protein [Deltaproteobacteria bacterium]|nr:TolC family protein [Deltaproteobacteria bacterium]